MGTKVQSRHALLDLHFSLEAKPIGHGVCNPCSGGPRLGRGGVLKPLTSLRFFVAQRSGRRHGFSFTRLLCARLASFRLVPMFCYFECAQAFVPSEHDLANLGFGACFFFFLLAAARYSQV